MQDDDPYLDVGAACAYLALTRRSLYRHVAQRQIRHTKAGGLLRFRRSWLDDYMRENERAPVVVVTRPKAVA